MLEGEDAAAYENLHNQFRLAIAPRGAIEEIWVRDFVDLVWEAMRLRRYKAKFLSSAPHSWVAARLEDWDEGPGLSFSLEPSENDLVAGWNRRDPGSIKKVNVLLKERHVDQEEIATQTFVSNLDTLERFDRMIMQAEGRRNLVLREIERRRATMAQRLRGTAARIEEAEFREISEGEGTNENFAARARKSA